MVLSKPGERGPSQPRSDTSIDNMQSQSPAHKYEDFEMHGTVKAILVLAAFLAVAAATTQAVAHHSFAIFDHTRTLTLQGTVLEFQWTNPHGYIRLAIDDRLVDAEQYSLELTSINMLRRAGWRSTDLEPGEHVTVITAPLLDGEPGGLLLELKTDDGRTLVPPVPDIDSYRRSE